MIPMNASATSRTARSPLAARLWAVQHNFAPYFFLAPFALLFAVFMLYPLARSLVLSLHKTVGPRHQLFVGFDNYRFLLRDGYFWLAVANTTAYTAAFVALQVPLSLGLALLLDRRDVFAKSVY